jgi:AmmeMemoRadiSam system protein B
MRFTAAPSVGKSDRPIRVRPPAAAGSFYPDDPRKLRELVTGLLDQAAAHRDPAAPQPDRPPQALIAPHAGYLYSGPIAASAFAALRPFRDRIRRVVHLGPAHRVRFTGLAAPTHDAFATPLGRVPLDRAALDDLLHLPGVAPRDDAHEPEHCLEAHLPFLQLTLDDFVLVPLLVGVTVEPEDVARVLDRLWREETTLVLVSSDLSHYLNHADARRSDQAVSAAIERLDAGQLQPELACGYLAIRALLVAAHRRGLHATTLDLRSSGDTAGPRDRVVGYGAYAFT